MNILSFDIEEWYIEQAFHGGRAEKYREFDSYLYKLLDLLQQEGKRATFFCLGKMAALFPNVVKRIQAGGHEIGCHSDRHLWITKMTPDEFLDDTRTAIDSLQQCTGEKVVSFRAPAFSIGKRNLWAFDVLAECGVERDASIFPASRDFGGFPEYGCERPSVVVAGGKEVKEFPIAMVQLLGKRIAYSGGGYFRFFPLWFVKQEMSRADYSMTYFHIGDLLPEQRHVMSREAYEEYFKEPGTLANRYKRYIKSSLGKSGAATKLTNLISTTDVMSIEQADGKIDWGIVQRIDIERFRGGGKWKLRILFLTLSRITDLTKRGIYTDLVRELVRQGHAVYVVTPFERATGRKTEKYQSGGATILGVRTLNIQKTSVIEKGIGTLLLEYQYMRAIKRHLDDVHFNLVLYSTPPITFNKVIGWAKREYGAKSYLMLKDIFPQNAVDLGMFSKRSPMYWMFRRKERRLYELSDHIGCMSPANCKYVIDHNADVDPTKVEICPNSVEVAGDEIIVIAMKSEGVTKQSRSQSGNKKIAAQSLAARNDNNARDDSNLRAKYGIPEGKVLCVYGGNLGKPQGVDFLIECVASNERRTNAFFLIVGSGTEFSKIKAWFDNHKPQNAMLLSALSKADYDHLMRSAQIGFIFLDRRFTIPNYPSRLLSYMENGIPIMMATDVNTDIGTIAEQNGYGLWCESGNLVEFDRQLDSLLASASKRKEMGERGYVYLLNHYTVAHTSTAILQHII